MVDTNATDFPFNEQEAKVAAMIVEMLGCDASKVTRTATLADLGGDSLDGIELVMEAEERFHCEISDDEADKVKTVADLFAVISVATAHEADATIRPVDGGQERFGRPLDAIRENPDAE